MSAAVDAEACIGCGRCEEICPEVFRMVDDKAVVQVTQVPPSADSACRQAQDECPVSAIALE